MLLTLAILHFSVFSIHLHWAEGLQFSFVHIAVNIMLIDTVRGQLILSNRVKSVFLHITLKVGYNSRKFGVTLSGRNYIVCRSVLLAAAGREKA